MSGEQEGLQQKKPESPSRRPGGMGGEVRPEVPWPGGMRWGHSHSSPRREEGVLRRLGRGGGVVVVVRLGQQEKR